MKEDRFIGIFQDRLNELVRDEMEKVKCKQYTVAKKIGIQKGQLSKYLNDGAEPKATTLYKIAKHFNVSTDYLLGRAPHKTSDTKKQDILDYTGLTEKALDRLHNLKTTSYNGDAIFSPTLSAFLEKDEITHLLAHAFDYVVCDSENTSAALTELVIANFNKVLNSNSNTGDSEKEAIDYDERTRLAQFDTERYFRIILEGLSGNDIILSLKKRIDEEENKGKGI